MRHRRLLLRWRNLVNQWRLDRLSLEGATRIYKELVLQGAVTKGDNCSEIEHFPALQIFMSWQHRHSFPGFLLLVAQGLFLMGLLVVNSVVFVGLFGRHELDFAVFRLFLVRGRVESVLRRHILNRRLVGEILLVRFLVFLCHQPLQSAWPSRMSQWTNVG